MRVIGSKTPALLDLKQAKLPSLELLLSGMVQAIISLMDMSVSS
jgi:hypothetical protein